MQSVLFRPDDGEAPTVGQTVTPAPVEPGWLDHATGWLDYIPGWAWALSLTVLTIATLITLPIAKRQAFKAGRRASGDKASDAKGTALFATAMVPAALTWLAVLAGSFRGLVGFGRDTLKWRDGWEYLVPLTLDGVAITFGFLAFRAVKAGRSPDRAIRIVMGTALASVAINYGHEVGNGGSKLGGAYLGLLSLLAMLIFDELLDQFGEGTAFIQRVNPAFGMRWITWPTNTACAWVAWRNYPPRPLPLNATDQQKAWWGSVNHAIAHLNTVRRAKRIAQYRLDVETAGLPAPWWMTVLPWPRVRQLSNVLSARDAEMADMAARLAQVSAEFEAERQQHTAAAESLRMALAEKVRAENEAAAALRQAEQMRADLEQQIARLRQHMTETVHRTESIADRQLTTARTELEQAATRLDRLEQQWIEAQQRAAVLSQQLSAARSETASARLSAEESEKAAAALRSALTEATEKHRTELAETVTRLQAENAETIARIRAEMSTVNLSEYRNSEGRKGRTGQRGTLSAKGGGAPNRPRMTDEEAVQALLRVHPEPEWQWSQPQIRDITGAGGERLQRLQTAIAEHHRRATAGNGRGGASGSAENGAGEVAVNGAPRRTESPNGARSDDLSDDDKEDSRGRLAAAALA
jgi:hypothetical protein